MAKWLSWCCWRTRGCSSRSGSIRCVSSRHRYVHPAGRQRPAEHVFAATNLRVACQRTIARRTCTEHAQSSIRPTTDYFCTGGSTSWSWGHTSPLSSPPYTSFLPFFSLPLPSLLLPSPYPSLQSSYGSGTL